MLKRNSTDSASMKIPIRTPRSRKNNANRQHYQHMLVQKYMQLSNNAINFWKIEEQLRNKIKSRELTCLISSKQYLPKYMCFQQIKAKIKNVIIERVQKDYLFGTTFHHEFRILQKHTRGQRKLKQRNFFNRYYFSSCPPKISLISQPTTTTLHKLKSPQTNSTIELKTPTYNLQVILRSQKKSKQKSNFSGQKLRKNDKSQKTIKRIIRSNKQIPQENYGLKNYKKTGKAKSKGKREFTKIKFCLTPQSHANVSSVGQSPIVLHQRLSQRGSISSRSKSQKNYKCLSKKFI